MCCFATYGKLGKQKMEWCATACKDLLTGSSVLPHGIGGHCLDHVCLMHTDLCFLPDHRKTLEQ